MKTFLLFLLILCLSFISASAQNFDIAISVTDGYNNTVLTVGVDPLGSDAYDPGLDVPAPPLPPAGAFGALLEWSGSQYFTDIRDNSTLEKTFILKYQPQTGGAIVLHWDSAALSTFGTFVIADDITGGLFSLDMTTTDSLVISSSPYITDKLRVLVTPAAVTNHPPFVANPIPDQNQFINFSVYTVANLNTVFDDPDGDVLNFNAATDGNTTVNINSDFLELGSVNGFTGQSQVIVSAGDSGFTVSDTFYVIVSDTGICPDFDFPITVTDGINNQVLTIGVDPAGTDGFDLGLDVPAPPLPPSGAFGTLLEWSGTQYFTDIRDTSITEKTFVMKYQAETGGAIVLQWDNAAISALGTFTITDDITGSLFTLDMSTTNSLAIASSPYITDKLRILVTPACPNVNHAPQASNDSLTVMEDTPGTVNVLVNDFDPDGDHLTVFDAGDGAHGTVVNNGDSTVTYTPQPEYYGNDVFTYIVSDGKGLFDTAQVYINVQPQNDAPVIALPDTIQFAADDCDSLDLWFFASDQETADSLLQFTFLAEPDTLLLSFNGSNGVLQVCAKNTRAAAEALLYVTVQDGQGGETIDSVQVIVDAPSAIDEPFAGQIPKELVLLQNFPNPFNPTTRIRFGLPQAAHVKIAVYNVLGQQLTSLVDAEQTAGYHVVEFDAGNLASGIYFYTLQTDGYSKIMKMVLMK